MRISKKEKELLQQVFEAPKPEHKKAFLRKLPKENIGIGSLILSQAAYVRKWVWVVSVLVLLLAAVYAEAASAGFVWGLSAFAPFLSASLLLELAKSNSYGMSELEASGRFSLKTILFARMGIIGLVHLLGLVLLAPVFATVGEGMLWSRIIYLVVPYLLTVLFGLSVVRKFKGRESSYICMGISLLVGTVCPAAGACYPGIYAESGLPLWGLAAVGLSLVLIKECRKLWNEMETNPLPA